ncbi:MAG: hypothetical protein AAF497_17900, partial [Planctomycetota bacterium]
MDAPFAGLDTYAIAFDDDFGGTGASQIANVSLVAGQSYYLLGTTYDPMPGETGRTALKTTVVGPGSAAEVGGMISGDFDGNGIYDCADIDSLVAEIASGANNTAFDLN